MCYFCKKTSAKKMTRFTPPNYSIQIDDSQIVIILGYFFTASLLAASNPPESRLAVLSRFDL